MIAYEKLKRENKLETQLDEHKDFLWLLKG